MDTKKTEPIFSETFTTRPTLFYAFFTLVCVIYLSALLLDPSMRDSLTHPASRSSLFLFIGLMLLVLWAFYTYGSGKILVEYFHDCINITYRKQQRTIPLKNITKVWMGRYRSGRERFIFPDKNYKHYIEAFPGSSSNETGDWKNREQQGEALVWNLDFLQFGDSMNRLSELANLYLFKGSSSQQRLRKAFPRFLILQPRSDAKPCMLRTQDTKKVLEYLRVHASQATFSPLIEG